MLNWGKSYVRQLSKVKDSRVHYSYMSVRRQSLKILKLVKHTTVTAKYAKWRLADWVFESTFHYQTTHKTTNISLLTSTQNQMGSNYTLTPYLRLQVTKLWYMPRKAFCVPLWKANDLNQDISFCCIAIILVGFCFCLVNPTASNPSIINRGML